MLDNTFRACALPRVCWVCRVYLAKLFSLYTFFFALSNLSLFTQHTRHSYRKAPSYKRFLAPPSLRAPRHTPERPAHNQIDLFAPPALGAKGKAMSARKRIRLSLAKPTRLPWSLFPAKRCAFPTPVAQPYRGTITQLFHGRRGIGFSDCRLQRRCGLSRRRDFRQRTSDDSQQQIILRGGQIFERARYTH